MKTWTTRAIDLLKASLEPPRHELNELDWKEALSSDKKRLTEHLSVMANQAGGGFLVFGVDATGEAIGITETEVEKVANQLANLGREALDPPLLLDHAVESYSSVRLLFVYVTESAVKPVHLRGKSLENAFIRSGGTTRIASRQEIGTLMLNSRTPRWEELRASVLRSDTEFETLLHTEPILKLLERPQPTPGEELLAWLPSKQLDRLIGTQPESRNEQLARAFRRYKICEERGSGLLKAGLQVELYGLPPIQFETGPSYFKVTLFAPRTFGQMSPRERLNACYQHAVLKHFSGGAMTNTSLRERLKMPEKQRSMVSVLIQSAIDQKLIKPADPENRSRKFAEYVPSWA
jgi:predicted HTH transcriptional regulator